MIAHTLSDFESGLSELRRTALTMASVAQHNLDKAIQGLLTRDSVMCSEAIADDDEVDTAEMAIDSMGHEIILRFSPVARDLRHVLSAMKIGSNLERISDQAVGVAKRARKIIKFPELAEVREIEPIAELAIAQLRDSMKAFADGNKELAETIPSRDKEINALHKVLAKRFTKAMEANPEHIRALLHLIFVVRSLERVGDHAVNIAEDTIFIESALDIRHT